MIQKIEHILDLYEYLAILQIEKNRRILTVFRRTFTDYRCVEKREFAPNDKIQTSLKLFSSDQKIPCILHYLTNSIKEAVIRLSDIEDDEVEEAIDRQKKNIFGINRLKHAKLIQTTLSKSDTNRIIKLSLLPSDLTTLALEEPLIVLTSYYNSIPFETNNEFSLLFHDQHLFLQVKKDGETIYQNSAIAAANTEDADQTLSRINRLLEQFQSETGFRLPNQIELINSPFKYAINQFINKHERTDFYGIQLIKALKLNQLTSTAASYLKRQRSFKAVALCGVAILFFYAISELFAFGFESAAAHYEDKVTALSSELYRIDQLQRDLKKISEDKREILSLLDTRSQVSYQVHRIAAEFNPERIWLKRIDFAQQDQLFRLEGFAKDEDDFNVLIDSLAAREFHIKPLIHQVRSYSDLVKNENLYASRLLHFKIEMSR